MGTTKEGPTLGVHNFVPTNLITTTLYSGRIAAKSLLVVNRLSFVCAAVRVLSLGFDCSGLAVR